MKRDNVLELLKMKDFVIPRSLIVNYRRLNLNEKDLIFLSFVSCDDDLFLFDVVSISEGLGWDISEIMEVVSSLCEKNIVEIVVKKKNGKMKEYLDISNLYEKLFMLVIDDDDEDDCVSCDSTIYNMIEAEFGRPLSPIEYETISGWINSNISEDLIKEALKEAVLNGVNNLKYIDKILFVWTKKGYKTARDVKKKTKNDSGDVSIFEYDWLDGNE